MNSLKKVAIAALLSTTAFSGALAADAITTPPPPVASVPVMDDGGFDWDGFYAGASVGGIYDIDEETTNWTLGAQAGVNATFDFFLVGAEVAIDGVFPEGDDAHAYGSILGRGGVVITDEMLAYAAVGYGSDFDADAGAGNHILAGGGLEFAVTDDVTLRGQYLYGWGQDDADSDIHKFTVGANFHF
ncbi:outer membrane protein [Pelagibacterium xiamenense]|uniref:outer membrane protein n=1 Tax=Pelagibacterium xiamenense TaxID=2901140 RepID=UPI001E5C2D89|nr:porin family protein [Pelagibacterium xiamenense]MCD7060896.1 porin family protein [Pelagibacterium xiamenense]